jgi:hypothetical protein
MERYIEVIVSPVLFNAVVNSYEEAIIRRNFCDRILARRCAFNPDFRKPGRSVIIRPNFTEPHFSQVGYREWRSFDGGLFTEIHFFAEGSVSQVRLDAEIVLPEIHA